MTAWTDSLRKVAAALGIVALVLAAGVFLGGCRRHRTIHVHHRPDIRPRPRVVVVERPRRPAPVVVVRRDTRRGRADRGPRDRRSRRRDD